MRCLLFTVALVACNGPPGSAGTTSGLPWTFSLDEEPSAYAEMTEVAEALGAVDADGHLDQRAIAGLQAVDLFDFGDELSELSYTEYDGIGRLVSPDGSQLMSRFTRVPGGDRFTGPNASSCQACHRHPIANAAGDNSLNVVQDPERNGDFNLRQTIATQGNGALQVIAEQLTEELLALKQAALASPDEPVRLLVGGGRIDYGTLTCERDGDCDYTDVEGISLDLVVRPFGWKGNFPTVRSFSADAAAGELGLVPDEIAWKEADPDGRRTDPIDVDGDGVARELSVGDVTAISVYLALQEHPTTVESLADQGLTDISTADRERVARGRTLFEGSIADGGVGCAECHVPSYTLASSTFYEPSPRAGGVYADQDLVRRDVGYDPAAPFAVDLTAEPAEEPRLAASRTFSPYTDFKRHYMGSHLADAESNYWPVDGSHAPVTRAPADADRRSRDRSTRIPRGEFLTPELWGVGSTGPWLHDGRALTLHEAILLHGEDDPGRSESEAQPSRDAFVALDAKGQDAVLAFLLDKVMVDFEAIE